MSSHDKEMKNIATNEESSSLIRGMAMAALVGSAMTSSGRSNSSRRGSGGGADCLSLSKLEFPLTIIRLMLDAKVCASGAEARRLIAAREASKEKSWYLSSGSRA